MDARRPRGNTSATDGAVETPSPALRVLTAQLACSGVRMVPAAVAGPAELCFKGGMRHDAWAR